MISRVLLVAACEAANGTASALLATSQVQAARDQDSGIDFDMQNLSSTDEDDTSTDTELVFDDFL